MQTIRSILEYEIAKAAAEVLRECFIKTARSEKVIYVENDILWSKTPDGEPIFIKELLGRNPSLSKKITNRKILKIKKGILNLVSYLIYFS
ncbi:hypothetical protein PGJ97_13025 [Acinetobacter baumannii]|uniref:hypothetical protein n=1 Tax=Acinetobacter baumannii TaxID=470 RepID=UPI00066DEAFB|nr:hypothetical protein [Acinetobacter baumannii]MBJ9701274.1 hypothetical protein [Acinetobacter baumannii]MCQ1074063.1 hypothetical protein [Acinetobacter baumannii]MCT9271756.1 hypothetical protein [Acinetobacter baumannii]MCZ3286824.1 hypothetical protein [Acinetobacter baumannii]MCZ3369854.1 hypothetical protein [Acinetobacter baumannii]